MLAELQQLGRRRQFVHAAFGRFLAEPVEIFAHRHAVERLRIAVALRLDAVLDRLGQDRRVPLAHGDRSASFERQRDRRHAIVRIDRHALARKVFQRRLERHAVTDGDGIAQVLPELGRDLFVGDEELRRPVFVRDHIRQRDRGMADIGAADIEQPGDRIERRDHCGVELRILQPLRHFAALFGMAAPGQIVLLDSGHGGRRLRPVLPHGV